MPLNLTERPLGIEEHNLVLATWVKEYRASPYAGCLPNHVSTAIYVSCIEDLILAGATLRGVFDSANRCLGWVCEDLTEDSVPVIHYIYLRPRLPADQFAEVKTALVPLEPGIYTYRTKAISDLLGYAWKHRPGFARSRSAPHENPQN